MVTQRVAGVSGSVNASSRPGGWRQLTDRFRTDCDGGGLQPLKLRDSVETTERLMLAQGRMGTPMLCWVL
jgi:hypothetical protein